MDVVHIYSAIKKNKIILSAATWMDQEIVILSETEKDKYHVIISHHLYVESEINDTNELVSKTERIHRHRKQIYGYQRDQCW